MKRRIFNEFSVSRIQISFSDRKDSFYERANPESPGVQGCEDTTAREETLILSVPTRGAPRSPIRFL